MVKKTHIATTLFASAVASAPVWGPLAALIAILGLPLWFMLGLLGAMMLTMSIFVAAIAAIVLRSKTFQDSFKQLTLTPSGQYVLFKPSAEVEHASTIGQVRDYIMEDPSRKLLASLAIDFLGNMSFALPGLGELADVMWAPVSATLLSELYGEKSPNVKYIGLAEEILPFTDFIPTATLAWYY